MVHVLRLYIYGVIFTLSYGMDIKIQRFVADQALNICSSNYSSVEVRKVKSGVICAALCMHHQSCCFAGFNKQTGECFLDHACFPECVPSQNATFVRKVTSKTEDYETTVSEITSEKTTKIAITSERATHSATTIEGTTNHDTTMKKLTSQKQTSNGPDCSSVTVGSSSGVYTIYVDNQPLDVYCEMTGSDQWTVFQKRIDGSTDFYRTWQEYKQGFGNVNSEFWLGNDNLHKILSTGNYKLRIDLEDWNGETRYAEYDTFVVGNEATNYVLTIANYNGNAGDSITAPDVSYPPNGYGFSTWDRDNDGSPWVNCGEKEYAGWWFNFCTEGNLNGKYYNGGVNANDGIYWEAWKLSKYSLRSVSMKIKQV